jgi:hypothetical protein
LPEEHPDARQSDRPSSLRADCARCVGLCCVAPAFEASAEFAFDKPAGQPCPNLLADFRCAIHDHLGPRGFQGCAVFDCQGAGQKVTQVTFGGRDWRSEPELAWDMFNAFAIMRILHELLWNLTDVLTQPAARSLHGDLASAREEIERDTRVDSYALMLVDVSGHLKRVNPLLLRASELVRTSVGPGRVELPGADLAGRSFRDTDLRGANLRDASLVRADLRAADLSRADLARADLRAADLRGANLATSMFLSQYQINTANGDATTRLPRALIRPPHWR